MGFYLVFPQLLLFYGKKNTKEQEEKEAHKKALHIWPAIT